MFPATTARVPEHTTEDVNERIQRQTDENIASYGSAGPAVIGLRLAELDREWDVERALQTNFAAVTLAGVVLGELADRRWHLFSALASGFMVQHALQGWCPPLAIFRRLGYRTRAEINRERFALLQQVEGARPMSGR